MCLMRDLLHQHRAQDALKLRGDQVQAILLLRCQFWEHQASVLQERHEVEQSLQVCMAGAAAGCAGAAAAAAALPLPAGWCKHASCLELVHAQLPREQQRGAHTSWQLVPTTCKMLQHSGTPVQ